MKHRNIIDSLWPRGPSLSRAVDLLLPFFLCNLEHEGRFGFTAQMTVAGTLRFIKPNETAHCSQRTDTGHRSNPHTAMTGLQMTPSERFSPLTTWELLLLWVGESGCLGSCRAFQFIFKLIHRTDPVFRPLWSKTDLYTTKNQHRLTVGAFFYISLTVNKSYKRQYHTVGGFVHHCELLSVIIVKGRGPYRRF